MSYQAPPRNPITLYPNVRAPLYGGLGNPAPSFWFPPQYPNLRSYKYGGLGNPDPDPFIRIYKRGLGQPIDIGTSATVDVTPSGTTVTGQGASAGYQQTTPAASPSITDWLNANSSTLLWVGGVAAGILVLSRMAR